MIISLPENFPLSPVTVETNNKTGPAMSNWRTWIVHLSVFLNNQVGFMHPLDLCKDPGSILVAKCLIAA